MSAGPTDQAPPVNRDFALLAPNFLQAVKDALADCAAQGFDAYVFEGYRTQQLQAIYYERGRTVFPPPKPVTNAPTNLLSWHGYGLAVDVISKSKAWNAGDAWFGRVAQIFKKHGCSWGGDWTRPDIPHFQWGRCKPSPSPVAQQVIASEGVHAVWVLVGAAVA